MVDYLLEIEPNMGVYMTAEQEAKIELGSAYPEDEPKKEAISPKVLEDLSNRRRKETRRIASNPPTNEG